MPKLIWRFPDRPIEVFSLRMIDEGEYLCQKKADGYFAVIIKDSDLKIFSRHNNKLSGVSPQMTEMIRALDLSDGDVLHGEWTSRREANRKEELYLFSWVYSKYEWLGGLAEEDRFNRLSSLKPTGDVHIIDSVTTGYAQMYKSTVDDYRYEGIVLKRRNSKLIGDLAKSVDNPSFLKVKWRRGSDSMTKNVIPDEDLKTRCKMEGR
jgi:ATP-dependent DNA ligase